MLEDYSCNHPSSDLVQQMVLIDIRNMLQSMGKDIRSFPLLDIDHSYDDANHIPREIFEKASVEQNPEDVLLCDSLNAEQRSAYDEIMATVYSKQGGLFFVDGPDGTGKTFLYRALLAKLRSQDKLAMAIHVCCKCIVPNVSAVSDVCCCKCFIWMLHMFHTYIASVLFRCCVCFTHML